MAGFWVEIVVALLGGVAGASAVLLVSSRGRRAAQQQSPGDAAGDAAPVRSAPIVGVQDRWLPAVHRCEQAVCRAARAVDSVSSSPARLDLHSIVRRMDAELPSVWALVELGRSLDAGGHEQNTARVLRQLDDAAASFAAVSDQVQVAVRDLVAAPDLRKVHDQVETLRDRFPLQRPMSALLGAATDTTVNPVGLASHPAAGVPQDSVA